MDERATASPKAHKPAQLSRQSIAAAGLTVLARTGLEGLTLRKLAAELGVRHGALYWHVKDKQDLLDEMAEALLSREFLEMPVLGEEQDWRSWLMIFAQRLRRSMLAHRDGAAIIATCQSRTRTAIFPALRDAMIAGLRAAGFSALDAFDIQLALVAYTLGMTIQEQAGQALPLQGKARFPRLIAQAEAGVPAPATGDALFTTGLGLLLSGAASLRARR